MGGLFAPSGGFKYSGATVHDAVKASSWQDLNLSAYVGTARRLVIMKYQNNTGGALAIRTRMNGDTTENDGYGANDCVGVPDTNAIYLLTVTDASGIIEWYSSRAVGTITVTLLGYI